MKPARRFLLILSAAVMCCDSLTAQQVIKDYSLRSVPIEDAKFDAVWLAVNETRKRQGAMAEAAAGERRNLVLVNRLAEGLWMAEVWEPGGVAGEAARAIGVITGNGGGGYVPPRYIGLAAVEISGSRADGDKVSEAVITDTGRVHRYTTVTGTEGNLRIYRLPGGGKDGKGVVDLTKLELIQRLQAGETFLAIQGEEVLRCGQCGGFGRVMATTSARRDADGKMKCPGCNGVGKATVPSVWKIVW